MDAQVWSYLREYQGRRAEALDSARAYYHRYRDSTESLRHRRSRRLLAIVHATRFAYDSAVVYALPRSASDSGSPLVLAASRFARGQMRQALAVQERRALGESDELRGSSHTVAESFTALAQVLISSDPASASRRLDRVLADTGYRNRHPANRHIRPILALALAGRVADAQRELTAIERASNDDVRLMHKPERALARGAVALFENRPRAAIAEFTMASQAVTYGSMDACRVCALPWLGRAYESARQPDSAAIVYERYLSTGDPFRVLSDAAWRSVILRRLGELHALNGDTVLAVTRLSEFVELWKDADSELQPEVEKARRRAAELRGNIVATGRVPGTLAAVKP
jgi:hypothetical protein